MKEQRAERILRALEERGLSQMLIIDPLSIYHLTEYANDPCECLLGLLPRKDGQHILFLSKLFYAPENSDVKEVWLPDTDPVAEVVVPYLMRDAALSMDKELMVRFSLPLMKKKAAADFVNSPPAVDKIRGVKDVEEQEKMRRVSDINDAAMAKFRSPAYEGATKREIADQMLQIHQDLGAKGFPFTPLTASGANAADPHHEPDNTVLKKGDCVLFDVGCVKGHRCSDMTRIFYYESASKHCHEAYETARAANEAATAIIRPGVRLRDTDKTARDLIMAKGYGPQFNHRLGHFIDLKDHEFGDVSSTFDWKVGPGMIFSVEPGTYLVGDTGARVEDLVMVTENGVEPPNHYSHELDVID